MKNLKEQIAELEKLDEARASIIEKHQSREIIQGSPCEKYMLAHIELWDAMYYADKSIRELVKQNEEKDRLLGVAKEALNSAEFALAYTMDACLCTRGTKGFDYGEKHKYKGKCEGGSRWLTPEDASRIPLEETRKALTELKGGDDDDL